MDNFWFCTSKMRRICFEKSNTGGKSLSQLSCFLLDHSFREFKAARDTPVLGSMGKVRGGSAPFVLEPELSLF